MDIKEKKEKLTKHLEVLNKAYDNIVEVLEEDVEKVEDKESGVETIALKDDKIKTYAEGIRKSAETLNYLYAEIVEKTKELASLNEEVKDDEPKISEPSDLNGRLK